MIQLAIGRTAAAVALTALLVGCSIKRYAINTVGDMLASGGSVFTADDDPILIGEALPFSLKLIESLLAEEPDHRGLLLAAGRGFVLYSYAYVHVPAEQAALDDMDEARALRARARALYLRAHSYALRALETDYSGIGSALLQDPGVALTRVGRRRNEDVAAMYWTAVTLSLAISVSRNEAALLARLPEAEALLDKSLELDEAWNSGALHEFSISLTASRTVPADVSALQDHYDRGLELSNGNRAGLHVAFAEAVAVPAQDRSRFVELLERALAVNLEALPDERLLNLMAQERARWLLGRVDELIL